MAKLITFTDPVYLDDKYYDRGERIQCGNCNHVFIHYPKDYTRTWTVAKLIDDILEAAAENLTEGEGRKLKFSIKKLRIMDRVWEKTKEAEETEMDTIVLENDEYDLLMECMERYLPKPRLARRIKHLYYAIDDAEEVDIEAKPKEEPTNDKKTAPKRKTRAKAK